MAFRSNDKIYHSHSVIRVCFVIGVLFLPSVVARDLARQVTYVGCKKRTHFMAFNKRYDTKNDTSMSVERCVEICWYHRSRMAAIQADHQCYCSWTLIGLKTVPDKECKSRCTGNCYQACGGPNTLSVYKTGYTREPTFVIEKRAYLPVESCSCLSSCMTANHKAFIGCYDSRTAGSILCPSRYAPLWTKRLTIPMCIYYCDAVHQTKFSTVAATDKCCCSDSVHGTRNTVLAWCDFHGRPCDGDKKQGCIGTQEKTLQWSTHQRDRIPNFKRWPKSMFTKGKWLKPNIKAGEKFLMTDLVEPIKVAAGDATLMGLLAKKNARKKMEGATKEETADSERRPMAGADKRDPTVSETKGSAGVVDVPVKAVETAAEVKEDDGSNGAIIAVVVIGFMILLASIGLYLYSQNVKKAQEAENKDSDDESNTEATTDTDMDDDDDEKKLRRRKKKKKKKRMKKKKPKKKRSRKSKEDDDETTSVTNDEDEDAKLPLLDESTEND